MPSEKPRILVVDDELNICQSCSKILAKLDYDVSYALNGYDALKMMNAEPFDVILTDLKMSSLGGMEVLRRVKDAYPDTIVIVMTGYASVSSAVEVMKMGALDYLPKPFTPDELLSAVKVVEPGYPYYGRVVLASGEPFREALAPGDIVVEQALLDRLGLAIGSRLFLGDAEMTIRDVVISEPDRPVTVFTLGPRIFVSARDRQRLGLITQGSRVRYMALLRLPASLSPEAVQEELWSAADPAQERVDTFRSADSRLKRFFDNLLFFLKLVGIFTLLLAGIGIQSVLTALMRARVKTMATMKALGAPNRFVMRLYLGVVLLLGVFGTACGIAAGLGLQEGLTFLLADLIPADATFEVAWGAVGQSLVIGLLAVVLFAARPVLNLKHFKPSALFRHEKQKNRWLPGEWLTVVLTTIFIVALVLWQLEDLRIGAYFIGGLLVLVGVAFLGTWLFLKALQRLGVRHLALRQAIRGLFRPRNATPAILVTLTASLTLIYAIFLIEKNLDATFVQAYPQDAPNVFFLDIQRDQTDAFARLVDRPLEFYPIVRAKLMAINGQAIDPGRERQRKSDNGIDRPGVQRPVIRGGGERHPAPACEDLPGLLRRFVHEEVNEPLLGAVHLRHLTLQCLFGHRLRLLPRAKALDFRGAADALQARFDFLLDACRRQLDPHASLQNAGGFDCDHHDFCYPFMFSARTSASPNDSFTQCN